MGSKMKIRSAVIEWQRRLDGLNVPILILGLMVSLWLLRGFPPSPIAWELFCAQWEYVLSVLEVRLPWRSMGTGISLLLKAT